MVIYILLFTYGTCTGTSAYVLFLREKQANKVMRILTLSLRVKRAKRRGQRSAARYAYENINVCPSPCRCSCSSGSSGDQLEE